jgi:hypothetical protein
LRTKVFHSVSKGGFAEMKYKPEDYEAKRAKVMQAITPICNVFGIKDYDYIFDEKHECLKLNNTLIGCSCNSVSAVVDELIGYIFVTIWCHNRCLGAFKTQTLNQIREYWIKEALSDGK